MLRLPQIIHHPPHPHDHMHDHLPDEAHWWSIRKWNSHVCSASNPNQQPSARHTDVRRMLQIWLEFFRKRNRNPRCCCCSIIYVSSLRLQTGRRLTQHLGEIESRLRAQQIHSSCHQYRRDSVLCVVITRNWWKLRWEIKYCALFGFV